MPIVNMKDMLAHAYRHNYAVGAFELLSLEFLEGVLAAAEDSRSPVILSLAEPHFGCCDFELLMPAVVAAARRAKVPVAVHLDRGSTIESATRAIRAGCNGVMIDFSGLIFPENRDRTKEVTDTAHACNVAVEGKLDYVAVAGGEETKGPSGETPYTLPIEAKAFVERAGVDCLCISVGTGNGQPGGVLKPDFARLARINETVGIPLVIDGGPGLSDDQFRRLIAGGVAKINYRTALADAAGASICVQLHEHPEGGYTGLVAGVRNAVRGEAERMMRLWGGGGRAAEVLAQCRPWREVEHVVLFSSLDTSSESAVTAMMLQGKDILGRIPGVRRVSTGKAVRGDAKYRYCWLVRFASQEVIDSYRGHPDHLWFANGMFRPVAPDRLTIDYEIIE